MDQLSDMVVKHDEIDDEVRFENKNTNASLERLYMKEVASCPSVIKIAGADAMLKSDAKHERVLLLFLEAITKLLSLSTMQCISNLSNRTKREPTLPTPKQERNKKNFVVTVTRHGFASLSNSVDKRLTYQPPSTGPGILDAGDQTKAKRITSFCRLLSR